MEESRFWQDLLMVLLLTYFVSWFVAVAFLLVVKHRKNNPPWLIRGKRVLTWITIGLLAVVVGLTLMIRFEVVPGLHD